MGTLRDPVRLLATWESAAEASGVVRGALILAAAGAVRDVDEALDLPIGDAALLTAELFAEAFGDVVDGQLPCKACGTELDVAVPLSEVAAPAPRPAAVLEQDGVAVTVRPPTGRDLASCAREPDPATALLLRCVSARDGELPDPRGWPPVLQAAVDEAAEELSGCAAVVVSTPCAACGAPLRASLDVAGLLWERVGVAAAAALADVADLASAFGWSEQDVLAMSSARRQAYLGLARGEPG